MTERRAGGEVRVSGRTLTGTAMRYGDISPDFRERFEPGAFGDVGTVDVNLQHDPGLIVVRAAALTDSPRELSVRADLVEGSAALALVRRRALNGFSVEFRATSERRDAAGVRVVERADLTGLALVDRGAYPAATAEVRARSGRTLRQRFPSGTNVGCRCSGVACKFARVMAEEMDAMMERAFAGAVEDIIAVRDNYGAPLASKSRGSVRGRMDDRDAVFEVDLPVGPDGDAVLRAVGDTGAVLIRPFLDGDESEGTIEAIRAAEGGNVMVYSKAVLRALIVGATDVREGWPEPELIPTPPEYMEREARSAPWRRRVWL